MVRVVVLAAIGLTLATIFLGCTRDDEGGETLPAVTPLPTPAASPTSPAVSLTTDTPTPATTPGLSGTPATTPGPSTPSTTPGPSRTPPTASQSTASPTASPSCRAESTVADRTPDGLSVVFMRDTVVDLGARATIPVTLSSAPKGLSGYMIEVIVADTDVATLEEVTFPEFGLVRRVPSEGPEIRLAAADLTRRVEPGAVDATLATLAVVGTRVGTTELRIRVEMMSDDDGSPMTPEARGATLTVC